MKLKGKTAIVTGASTGIGRAIAIEFAREGAFVVITARGEEGLKETSELIKKAGGSSKVIPADLSKIEAINKFVKEIGKEVDKVNVLVNVAGIWHGKDEVYAGRDFEDFSQKVIMDTLTVGLTAPTLLVHGLISQLALGGGTVINISGTFENGAKGWLPYYVSKKAIEDLTVGLAEELKRVGIEVNCISPSDTATEAYEKHFPQYMKDAISPKEIAKQAVYLSSDEANNTTGKVWVMEKGKELHEGFHK